MKVRTGKVVIFSTMIVLECLTTKTVFAALPQNLLPSSTMPGIVTQQQEGNRPKRALQRPTAQLGMPEAQEGQGLASKEAEQIKFVLTKVILEGNHVYSTEELESLFKTSMGKKISVAELQGIVQTITNYYRNNGYVLSRALLPPQRVVGGTVKIQVVEGYINQVLIAGSPGKAGKIVAVYGRRAIRERPLQLSRLEYYLRLANQVPGVSTRAVLQPSQTAVGASDLQLVTDVRPITGFLSYNNYGTRYIGPNQLAGQMAVNSFFRSGDSTRLMYSTTPGKPKQLKFYDASYSFLLGSSGVNLIFGKNQSSTQPGFTLTTVGIEGSATTYYAQVQYPLIINRDRSLSLDGAFNYLDSKVQALGTLLYFDHLRTVRAGGTYSFVDRFQGSNQMDSHAVQGLTLLGATHDIHSTTTSRFGGRGDFTRVEFHATHIQPVKGRYSISVSTAGQYAFNPLLSSEQFGFGGNQMGRGYDPAEIIGDRGCSGSVELRADYSPGFAVLSYVQPYLFYDQGVIWNLKNVTGIKQKQSAASTGAGARFTFTAHVTGEVFIGQPLTKSAAALQIVGNGRQPRLFFGVVFSA